ncbi:MAG: hypothetical protein WA154_11130 [Moraxellaceae bacterium]
MSEKLRIIPGPTRWRHECKSHGDWRSFHNGITFCPTCGMDKDGLMAEPPIPFDGSVILRRAGATPPASHDAGEAVAEVYSHQSRDMCKVSTLHASFSRSVPVGTKLYPESALTALTAEVSRLTGERDQWRRLAAPALSGLSSSLVDQQQLQDALERSRKECERLREALEVMLEGDELGEAECQRIGFPRMITRREKARAALSAGEQHDRNA